ncbi:MAG: hypothetical protein KC657_27880 [Myxococcales bacterium]|nr:hypothetical protein [Myxococcales bacterium]
MRNLESCRDLTDADIDAAVASSETMGALLSLMERLAKPEQGAPKILSAIARIAASECVWMDGDLRVEIDGDAQRTSIAVLSELGAGFREAVFPRLKLDVPLEEFSRAIRLAPQLYAPLVQVKHPTRIVLVGAAASTGSLAPPVEIAEESMRRSLPPTVRRPRVSEAPASRPSRRPTRPPAPELRAIDDPPRSTNDVLITELDDPGVPVTPRKSPIPRKVPGWEHVKPTVRRMPAVRVPIVSEEGNEHPTVTKMPAVKVPKSPPAEAPGQRPTVRKMPAVKVPKR